MELTIATIIGLVYIVSMSVCINVMDELDKIKELQNIKYKIGVDVSTQQDKTGYVNIKGKRIECMGTINKTKKRYKVK